MTFDLSVELSGSPNVEVAMAQVAATGVATFGQAAQLYKSGYVARELQISKPTPDKETFYLDKYIIPTWGSLR